MSNCEQCALKEKLLSEIKKAEEKQKYYDEQIQKANQTVAKYTRKLEELE